MNIRKLLRGTEIFTEGIMKGFSQLYLDSYIVCCDGDFLSWIYLTAGLVMTDE